jgi:hypothetical protein
MKTNNRKNWKLLLVAIVSMVIAIIGQIVSPVSAQAPPTSTPPPGMIQDEFVKDENYQIWDDVTDEEGGLVDIFDLSFVASHYKTTNRAADVNDDGWVDVFDLAILASSFDMSEAEAQSSGITPAIVIPEPLPIVEAGSKDDDFGETLFAISATEPEAGAQAYYTWRPLKVGLGIDHVRSWDYMDGETKTPPDFYAVASIGGSAARTSIVPDQFEAWPYWRLGWWRYNGFPQFAPYDPAGDNYFIPITLQIRDDDGYICYGYYGCRHGYEVPDITLLRQERTKSVHFYPSGCKVVDENGIWTQGQFLDGYTARCRVNLLTWGDEWPRAEANYFIDALWE